MLVTAANMREYFREALVTARNKTGVTMSEHAEAYVVHLLCDFARSENAWAGTDKGERPTLAVLLSRAREAEPGEAVRIYKHMGDSSLYLTGFFPESVERAAVNVDYYVSMGGSAYAAVAGLVRPTAATSSALFAELSDRFCELVELLTAISLYGETERPGAGPQNDSRVLELLERYRRTGRKELLEALEAHGVVLKPGMRERDDEVH
jgi:hypothetical protein